MIVKVNICDIHLVDFTVGGESSAQTNRDVWRLMDWKWCEKLVLCLNAETALLAARDWLDAFPLKRSTPRLRPNDSRLGGPIANLCELERPGFS
jgi:hypothetical protein